MRTIRLTVAYDGTAYAGWQVQPDAVSVQGTFERAVAKITGETVRVTASGRTDAGVHALGQVVAFRTESTLSADVFRRALNAELPDDVAVLEAIEAALDFHPIRDARGKRYRYVILDGPERDVFTRRYAWHYRHSLDDAAMARAARALLGTHDFSGFAASGSERLSHVRTIRDLSVARGQGATAGLPSSAASGAAAGLPSSADNTVGQANRGTRAPGQGRAVEEGRGGRVITIEIEADGFLYNMARAIVGTLVEVGRGVRDEAWVAEVLAACNRRVAGPNAPPHGLYLVNVEYPESCESPTSSPD